MAVLRALMVGWHTLVADRQQAAELADYSLVAYDQD